tara:strand:- start:4185 stop:4478 length:294 start_codon:yes stop_codon:yes gene_type:complete
MSITNQYEQDYAEDLAIWGNGFIVEIQFKEITDDIETYLGYEINVECASWLIGDLDENNIGRVFFETGQFSTGQAEEFLEEVKRYPDFIQLLLNNIG